MRGFDELRYFGPGPRGFGLWHLMGPLFMLLILGLLVYLAIMTFRATRGFGTVRPGGSVVTSPPEGAPGTPAVQTPLEVAKMRYARGEISREEFETLRQDLQ